MEHEYHNPLKMRIFLTLWAFFFIGVTAGQPDTSAVAQNELTIYVIPSKVKYDWSSPYSLYKSYFKNYKRNLFKKERYIMGHAFVELRTPLNAAGRIFTGMRSASRKEQKDLVLKEHYGLSILGADMEGKLETPAELNHTVEKFSRKGQLAFMSFFISDSAAERMLAFFRSYKAGIDSNGSRGARYGGAFYPRYQGEGSGCSAFAVSFLDLAGLLKDEFDEWMVKIDIPMDLIGGPYNNYHDVRFKDIKKYKSWTENYDTTGAIYEPFEIFDPSLMYEWIQEEWEEQEDPGHGLSLTPLQLNSSRGILIDCRAQPLPEAESIFLERKNHSIFIDYYFQKSAGGN
jgi:hypothetical protein